MVNRNGMRGGREYAKFDVSGAEVELEADRLLAGETLDGIRVLTERQLLRKIREEISRLPEARLDQLSAQVVDYMMQQHERQLLGCVKLSQSQKEAFCLSLRGLNPSDISRRVGVSRTRVVVALFDATQQIKRSPDKYEGLWEVYYSEVHRNVYRKPRHKA
jgi:hypothetical protein